MPSTPDDCWADATKVGEFSAEVFCMRVADGAETVEVEELIISGVLGSRVCIKSVGNQLT